MSEIVTVTQTADWLRNRDNFLLLTHHRPDGDTLGSAGALAQGLRETGKTAYLLLNHEATPRYMRFVQDYWAPDGYEPEYIIAIDTASLELIPENGKNYVQDIDLRIDHHPSNISYASNNCIDVSRASCGEIIYDILMELAGHISVKTAGSLYAALSTDTGCFVYANTTANTLHTAAALIEAGAPHKELNRFLFRTKTLGRISVEGMILSNLEFYYNNTVALSVITRKMLESAGATEDDVDNIAAIPGSVEGVCIGITIRELTSTEDCKVSVRTGVTVDAHSICAHFGGGGHAMAAGFSRKATAEKIKEDLLEVLKVYIPG